MRTQHRDLTWSKARSTLRTILNMLSQDCLVRVQAWPLCTHSCKHSIKAAVRVDLQVIGIPNPSMMYSMMIFTSWQLQASCRLGGVSQTWHCNPKSSYWSNQRPDSATWGNRCCSLPWRWQGRRPPPHCIQHQQYSYGTQIYVRCPTLFANQPGQNTANRLQCYGAGMQLHDITHFRNWLHFLYSLNSMLKSPTWSGGKPQIVNAQLNRHGDWNSAHAWFDNLMGSIAV